MMVIIIIIVIMMVLLINNSSYSDLDSNFLNYYFLKSFGMIFFNSSFNIYLFLKLNLVIFLDWMLQV
jgi:hypothetical protein